MMSFPFYHLSLPLLWDSATNYKFNGILSFFTLTLKDTLQVLTIPSSLANMLNVEKKQIIKEFADFSSNFSRFLIFYLTLLSPFEKIKLLTYNNITKN